MRPQLSNPLRAFALLAGLVLVGTFVSVFYHIVDVVGGVAWLAAVVVTTFLLATVCARRVPVRAAGAFGLALFVAGGGLYVWFAPAPFHRVFAVEFLTGQFTYLTGTSVLQFTQVDVWAIAIAPAPVFLTWYLLVRRRYDLGALTGGVTLGYFVLTGDAGWSTTLVGTVSVLGVLGLGALERASGTWEQVERLGFLLVVATLLSQPFRNVGPSATSHAGTGTGGGGGERRTGTVETSLTESNRHVRLFDEVTLSPEERFTVTSDAPAYWHVASYDRYTGTEWVLTGETVEYSDSLAAPPGETVTVEQTVRAEGTIETMPAAWKPVVVTGGPTEDTHVSSTGGLVPTRPRRAGEEYTVVSQVPDTTLEQLRSEDVPYPDRIRERYLQLPESTPSRLGRKAREITAGSATAYDAARAVETWLESNKAYSLAADRPDGDVADAFVFEMDRGYCVYYATTMTVLLRTLDVPARFSHGYLPGERVADGDWLVRGLDAHAWTEVYFPDVGWVPFDPTPSDPREAAERSRLEEAQGSTVGRIASEEARQSGTTATPDRSTEIRNVASPTPVNDSSRSPTPSPNARTGSPTPGGTGPDESRTLDDRLSTTVSGMDRLTLVGTVAGIALGVRRLRLFERGYRAVWLRRQPRTGAPRPDVERAFERLEYLLVRRYRPRASGETPRQYLEALSPAVDPRAHRVRQLYEKARYGGQVSRDEADEAIRLVDELVDGTD